MKRKSVLILTIFMIILSLCTACAANVSLSDSEKEERRSDILSNEQNEEVQTEEVLSGEMQTEGISDSIGALGAQDMGDTYNTPFSIERTTRASSVSLNFYTEEQSTKLENDTVLCTKKCVYPVVKIEDNEIAADKINADIQKRVDAFHADNDVFDIAQQDYQVIYANNPEFHFSGYSDELIFTAARADSKVISFLVTSQYYAGGAHGMDTYIGLNYDTQIGELIDFADLSENENAFAANTLTFLQSIASTAAYQGIMWEDGIDDLQAVLYQDNRWYLSTSGLVFFSDPYELGAFYAGRIKFTVPYSDLVKIGFKEKYDSEGALTIRLQTEEVCSYDLNGDGQREEIQFFIDNMGRASADVHFIIDGTDYAVEHQELSRQFSDDKYLFCWTECHLYDMDSTDDMTEIAFQMNYIDDIVTPYTFLYRYEGNGVLTYLGRIKGTITDPTAVFYIMPQDSVPPLCLAV